MRPMLLSADEKDIINYCCLSAARMPAKVVPHIKVAKYARILRAFVFA